MRSPLPRHGLNYFDLAERYVAHLASLNEHTHPGLWLHQQRWLEYRDGVYHAVLESDVSRALTRFLATLFSGVDFQIAHGRHQATTHVVREVMAALRVVRSLEAPSLPFWTGDSARAHCERIVTKTLTLVLDPDTGLLVDAEPPLPDWVSVVQLPIRTSGADCSDECPRWTAYLTATTGGDPELMALLQEIAGWLLVPDTSYQKFVLFYGDAGTGKSTFLRTVTALLGTQNVSAVGMDRLTDRFSPAEMQDKLANLCGDMGKVTDKVEGVLKMLTGEDTMMFERKHQKPYSARATARLIFATNELPAFTDRSDGIWRRLILVPFVHTVPENQRDAGLEAALRQEMSGIFSWALHGLLRLRQQKAFTPSSAVHTATSTFKAESNEARTFLLDHCEAAAESLLTVDELYRLYEQECSGSARKLITRQQFGHEVKQAFPSITKSKAPGVDGVRVNAYKGIRYR